MSTDENENGRLNLIEQLNEILELGKRVYNKPNFKFTKATYYGRTWLDVMECLENDGQKITHDISRKIFKAYIVFESVNCIKGTTAYFDQSRAAWEEKVKNLFEAPDEKSFDSLSYEFYIGANMAMDNKKIYFCNMDTSPGAKSTDSLCEYLVEPRLFIECKNLFGVGKSAIDNNIRRANQQIRSTMQHISVENPIGVVFLDLSEDVKINDRVTVNEKIVEALRRVRQCNETHFLVVTYLNVVTENGDSDAYNQMRLIVNPLYKDTILTKANLLLFQPKFRMVSIPDDEYKSFEIYDFISGQRKSGISFDKIFCF